MGPVIIGAGIFEMRRKHSEVPDIEEIQRILSLTNIGRPEDRQAVAAMKGDAT